MTKLKYSSGRARKGHRLFKITVFFLLAVCMVHTMKGSLPLAVSAAESAPCFSPVTPAGFTWYSKAPSLPAVPVGISAQSAILINADTGEVIYRHNEAARLPMASTTKIMTALIAVEALPLDTPITITAASVGVEGSSIYLTEGEILTLEELLYAMLLESANDAATAIAIAVSGTVEDFALRMNQKARELGLEDTHFVNPHGLDDPEHYTTAYELATIARAALSHEALRDIMSTQRKTIPHNGDEGIRLLLNHNKLLRTYEGSIGVKTGFTKKSGRCLVSAAEREGLTLIAVTLNAPNDWQDHADMLDYGFSLYETVELCPEGAYEAPLWVVSGTSEYVIVKNTASLILSLPKNRGDVRCVVELPRFAYAPIQEGQAVGRLVYYEEKADGSRVLLGEVPLLAQYESAAVVYKKSLLEKLSDLFGF